MKTITNNREARLTAIRLVNNYKKHNNNTGFLEWVEKTPAYVKQVEIELSDTINSYKNKDNERNI